MNDVMQKINRVLTGSVILGLAFFIAFAAQLVWWSLDRTAPFELVSYVAPSARPGDTITIRAKVHRNLTKSCSVLFSRSFFDSAGTRFELTDGAQLMNHASLQVMNDRTPDALYVSIKVPLWAAPGSAIILTTLDYQCNPMHQLYPISVVMVLNMEVISSTKDKP